MKPYIAVIKDSFRAALASKVLYIMLVLITFVLLFLAPWGYEEELTTNLTVRDVLRPFVLADRILQAASEGKPSPAGLIWGRLDDNLQQRLQDAIVVTDEKMDEEQARKTLDNIREATEGLIVDLDRQLQEEDFYDAKAWEGVKLNEEAQELLDQGVENLTHEEVRRFNRLALDAAFTGLIRGSATKTMRFYYGWWETGLTVPQHRNDLAKAIHENLPWFLDKIVLSIGMIVAIVVTASIVPQMFEPGSLHLLLSKPISRSLLFLSKFFGGCAFAFLCAAYLFAGLWLLMGIRLGIWEHGVLISIPLYVFVFAIYYTTSAIAGIVFRNAIVSVVMAALFWAFCWGLGMGEWSLGEKLLPAFRIAAITPTGNGPPVYNDLLGDTYTWNESNEEWEKIFADDRSSLRNSFAPIAPQIVGPVYSRQDEQLMAVATSFRPLSVTLEIGRRDDDWRRRTVANAPVGIQYLLPRSNGDVLALDAGGQLHRIDRDRVNQLLTGAAPNPPEEKNTADGDSSSSSSNSTTQGEPPSPKDDDAPPQDGQSSGNSAVTTRDLAQWQETFNPFLNVGPETPLTVSSPSAAVIHDESGLLAFYNRGLLTMLKPDAAGQYAPQGESWRLPGDEHLAVNMVFLGDDLLLGREDGKVFLLDLNNREIAHEFQGESDQPRTVAASPDGIFGAVLYSNQTLYLFDAKAKKTEQAPIPYQGDITAIAFTERNRLLVASGENRIIEYRIKETITPDRKFAPAMGAMQRFYRMFVHPCYTICPKPGEFYKTLQYLLLQEETVETVSGRQQLHPWRPIWNGLAFMGVFLALACLYMERKEF